VVHSDLFLRADDGVATTCHARPGGLDPSQTTWDAGFMTDATKKLIEEIEALPDQERSELVAELARRVALAPHDLPTDADLVASADRLFVELDRRELPE
jgi:hypothetical protein